MTTVLVLDCESTGKDPARDQVVELCAQLGIDETGAIQYGWRVKPTIPIHPEAQAVHGITAEALADCPSFRDIAPDLTDLLNKADVIAGYNIRFDVELLQAEYERNGLPLLDLSAKKLVDAFRLWQSCEPRSLMDAHRRFAGGEFEAAHSASADIAATARVLRGMLNTFGIADDDWAAIAAKSDPLPDRLNWVGPTKHFKWSGDEIVFGFGKHAGVPILAETGFLQWMLRMDFPAHAKEIAHAAVYKRPNEFRAFIAAKYPRQVPTSEVAAPPP